MAPHFFRFVKTDFIIPPTAWSSFTIAAQPQFLPSHDASYPTLTKFAWGGYFDDDIVALRTMNPHVGKNYSEFSIFERTSDTWSRNFSVTGSDVSTTAGNGVWFVSNGQTHNGVSGWDHHKEAMDESTTYDSSTKTMYVLAATSSLASEKTFTGTNIYGIPVFKTQKSGDTWSDLTEAGLLPTASYQNYPGTGDYATRAIKYVTDGTIATLATRAGTAGTFLINGAYVQSQVHFTDSTTFEIVDSVPYSNYDPSGINHTINYWGSIWGTNQSKTKVYVGGSMEGAGVQDGHRHLAIQILSSGSSNGWELEGQITGSAGGSNGADNQYFYNGVFDFNDNYAVLGIPTAATDNHRTGRVYIYKKTGATWADNEVVQILNGSASYDLAGITQAPSTRFQDKLLFGRGVRINSNNEILVAAPHFHVTGMEHKAGLVMFLTKSDGSDEWGYQSHHTGSINSSEASYPSSAAMFTPRYFGTDRAIVTAPSGSRDFMGFEIFKNEEV